VYFIIARYYSTTELALVLEDEDDSKNKLKFYSNVYKDLYHTHYFYFDLSIWMFNNTKFCNCNHFLH